MLGENVNVNVIVGDVTSTRDKAIYIISQGWVRSKVQFLTVMVQPGDILLVKM